MIAWLLTWWWQGLVVTVAVAAVLKGLPHVSAATRYRFWCGALVAVAWLGLAGMTAVEPAACAEGLALCSEQAEPVFPVREAPRPLVTAAFGIWTTMTFFALVGLLRSLHGMFAQRDRCRPFPAHLEERLPLWQQTRRRGRKVTLAISDSVSGAVMFGLHNPCIALPASLVESLTPDELDLVVLHEHAHAQRRDDWAALVQALLRPALWMHPAAWFVTRSMGFEREAACDEQVVARTGMP
jgi:D-alanyl-D-alanine endopeptidase (penicillin-binding protein 7)